VLLVVLGFAPILREVLYMKVRLLSKSESAIAIAVRADDADVLRKSSVSKQAFFMRKVWKEFSTFPQPRKISYFVIDRPGWSAVVIGAK